MLPFSRIPLFLKISVKRTGLNTGIVLVFATDITVIIALYGVIIDLADFYIRVDPDRLDAENLQCPIAGEPNVAKTSRHVDE